MFLVYFDYKDPSIVAMLLNQDDTFFIIIEHLLKEILYLMNHFWHGKHNHMVVFLNLKIAVGDEAFSASNDASDHRLTRKL